jgi:hypothetical protein
MSWKTCKAFSSIVAPDGETLGVTVRRIAGKAHDLGIVRGLQLAARLDDDFRSTTEMVRKSEVKYDQGWNAGFDWHVDACRAEANRRLKRLKK